MAPNLGEKAPSFDFGGSTRIIVTVKGKRIGGSVSPHVMAHASPVWNKFLLPPFRKLEKPNDGENHGGQPPDDEKRMSRNGHNLNGEPIKELDFSEDPAEALEILLSIVHFKFNKIPVTLGFPLLWQVAMLCDQYDCAHLVKPWLSNWLTAENSVCHGITLQVENWLLIAWVFGRKKVFEDVANSLVLNIRTYSQGKCLALQPGISRCPIPPDILESILRVRKTLITRLLEIPKKCSQEYTDKLRPPYFPTLYPDQEPNKVLCKHGNQACDAMSYGSLLCGMAMIGINTTMAPNEIDLSVKEIADKLSNLTIHIFPDKTHYNAATYNRCFPTNIRDEVAKVLQDIEDPVLDSHLRHLSVQAAKLD